jgi:hypothetical protein
VAVADATAVRGSTPGFELELTGRRFPSCKPEVLQQ